MATATESDVKFYLPQSIESIPSSSEIANALDVAATKVSGYDIDNVSDAEAVYAALTLVEHKYRMPKEQGGPSMNETFDESPAKALRKKFKRMTKSSFRVL